MLTRENHPFPWHISKPLQKKPAIWFIFIAKRAHGCHIFCFSSPGHQLLFHSAAPRLARLPAASELLPGAVLLQAKTFPVVCHCWAPGGSHHPTAPAWLGPSEKSSSRVLGSNVQTTACSSPWGAAEKQRWSCTIGQTVTCLGFYTFPFTSFCSTDPLKNLLPHPSPHLRQAGVPESL